MEKVKRLIPFIADMREPGVYHQVRLTISPDMQSINLHALASIPVESVTKCSDELLSVSDLDKTFSFIDDKNLSDHPKGVATQLILDRISKELRDIAEQCMADYILISQPEVLEYTNEHYRVRMHYMLMVRT